MSADSLFSNDSLLHVHLDNMYTYSCFIIHPGKIIFSTFNVTQVIVLLPLCAFIIYFGVQRLKEKTSTISPCDIITYHMVVMEMIGIVGCVICLCGNCEENQEIFNVGMNMFAYTWHGQIFFHILTCVERYLAVVHPVTYLSLRTERGIRIRNVSVGCVWVLCFGWIFLDAVVKHIYLDVFLLIISTTIISVCSLLVLRVLIRPGPGEQDKGRERVDQTKRRAFYTIMVILGLLMLRLSFGLVWSGLELSGQENRCIMIEYGVWLNLPTSLVLPLLFLQRAGKLKCCKK